MSVMIQVRNVPDELHRELVRRAKARGMTLTAYVQSILEREVATTSRAELLEKIRSAKPVKLSRPVAELIHEGRAERSG